MAVGLFRSSTLSPILVERFADSAQSLNAHTLRFLCWRRHSNLAFDVAEVPHGAGAVVEKTLQAFVAAQWDEDDRADEPGGGVLIVE